ncbi:rhomboid family intramembrane serine protease [Cystobacter fuscus]|uniref:rhomboid family intramembrane serine protease n=1 Tax=Cystobacter fuscus TaxID=43 RepID=UPI002B2C0314|nr:rhomboid family intramembrane serine protease [Cystobacter fuscus]
MTSPTAPHGAPPSPGTERPPPPPFFPRARAPRPPPVCAAIIGGSVALFVVDAVLTQGATLSPYERLGPLSQWLALYGPLVQDGQYWRVLSCSLAHRGPLHLAFNMWVAYSLGSLYERAIGSGRFLLLSIITALGSSAFALLFNFKVPAVGASGMILGYGGAMLVTAKRQFRRGIIFWLAQMAVLSLIPGVSWAGHLGGFLFGLPVGVALRSGHPVFVRAAPLLLIIAVAVVYITAHPERFRG